MTKYLPVKWRIGYDDGSGTEIGKVHSCGCNCQHQHESGLSITYGKNKVVIMGGNPSFMRGHDAVGVLTAKDAKRIVAAHNATYAAGIEPEAVKDLVAAAKAGVIYDAAIAKCGNDPDKMITFHTAAGDGLDTLYDSWITKTQAALARAKLP